VERANAYRELIREHVDALSDTSILGALDRYGRMRENTKTSWVPAKGSDLHSQLQWFVQWTNDPTVVHRPNAPTIDRTDFKICPPPMTLQNAHIFPGKSYHQRLMLTSKFVDILHTEVLEQTTGSALNVVRHSTGQKWGSNSAATGNGVAFGSDAVHAIEAAVETIANKLGLVGPSGEALASKLGLVGLMTGQRDEESNS